MRESPEFAIDCLIHSDILIALFDPSSERRDDVEKKLAALQTEDAYLATTSWAVAEAATQLNKASHALALKLLKWLDAGTVPVVPITADIEDEAWKVFCQDNHSGEKVSLTMTECATIASVKIHAVPKIFTLLSSLDLTDTAAGIDCSSGSR